MIPERTPGKMGAENGVRYRIAACRQRLRNSRTTHRAINHSQIQNAPKERALLASAHTQELLARSVSVNAVNQIVNPSLFGERATEGLEEVVIT